MTEPDDLDMSRGILTGLFYCLVAYSIIGLTIWGGIVNSICAFVAILAGLMVLATGLLTIFAILFPNSQDEVIERRLRDVRREYPDYEGDVSPFKGK